MTVRALILVGFMFFASSATTLAQLVGFRVGVNSGIFVKELGRSDVPHPDVIDATPALSTRKFSPQLSIGAEGEVLFQVSPSSHLGIELEYVNLKGYNDTPPVYNYYLTPYYFRFQPGGAFVTEPVAFNTRLFNLAANWRYFFFDNSPIKPFVKLTGVVTFLGTDLSFKETPPTDNFDSEILYARGTSNSDQKMLPAFHIGGGIGFEYFFSDRWSVQGDLTATAINSDITDGIPNFTYHSEENMETVVYNKHFSLITQISLGIVYSFEVSGPSRAGSGKTDPNFPFYRKK